MKKYLSCLLAIVFALSTLSSALFALADTGESGLVAKFDFDSGLSANGYTATLGGGATVKDGRRSGKYVSLDGGSSYLSLSSTLLDQGDGYSISLWLHLPVASSPWSRILEIGAYNTANVPYKYTSLGFDGESKMRVATSANIVSSQNVSYADAQPDVGGWSHLVFAVGADGTHTVYLNGQRVLSAKFATNPANTKHDLIYIGKSLFESDPYATMDFDDVKVYSRALTADEVATTAEITDRQAVDADVASVNIAKVTTSTKLNLFKRGNNGSAVTWTSSNPSVIDGNGYVFSSDQDKTVKLTAVFSRGNVTVQKEFETLVKAQSSNVYADNTDPSDVTLLGDNYFTQTRQLNKDYMMSFDAERLLVNYKKTSGLPTGATQYEGWITAENGGSGNTMGHYLSALTYLYAEEGDTEVGERLDYMLAELVLCMDNYGKLHPSEKGYWGGVSSSVLTDLENGGNPFVPYYVIEKNIWGAYNAYTILGNQDAKALMYGLGEYTANRINSYSDEMLTRVLKREYGGIGTMMFMLYGLSGNKAYLTAAQKFLEPAVFDLIDRDEDPFAWKHANTQIPKIYSAAWGYYVTGDQHYLELAKKGFDYLTVGRTFATGNISETEDLHPQHETDTGGFQSCETCCAYNLMRLSDMLYRLTGEKSYMDYYEKLFYNCILASIDTETGMKTYYVSMDSGYYKVYHTAYTSFWCCTGTGLESFAKMNQNIYYLTPDSLTVNLFVPSEYTDKTTGLGVKMQTNLPDEDTVKITVTKGANTTLRIRNPYWSNGTVLTINGKSAELNIDGNGYINVTRNFAVGDVIEVTFPMSFRLDRLDSTTQPHSDAIMYGPLVMNGVIDSIGDVSPIQNNANTGKMDGDIDDNLFYTGNSVFDGLTQTGVLEYDLAVANQTVHIKPFFRCHRERYIIYWNVYKVGSAEQAAHVDSQNANKTYLIDTVDCGNWFEEIPHGLQYEGTWIGNYSTEHNRGLVKGGWFSYNMRVERGVGNYLRFMHFGTDSGYGYDVYVNGTKIASADITAKGKMFYWNTYPIPDKYTANADYITVKVVCTYGTLTTGIYTVETRRDGLAKATEEKLTIASGDSRTIALNNLLCDKFEVTGVGNVTIEGVRDGVAEHIYTGGTGIAEKLAQYSQITIRANTDFDGTVTVYGDKIQSIDKLSYTAASPTSHIKADMYATVNTQNCGTVRMLIDWFGETLGGNASGQAKVYGLSDKVSYEVVCKKLNDGLIAYYDFEEVTNGIVADESGNGNDGQTSGRVRKAHGKYGNGLNLGGLDGCVLLPTVRSANGITMSMWVRFNSDKDVTYQRLFDLGNDRHNYLTYAACGYVGGAKNGTVTSVAEKVWSFGTDKWHHYAVTVGNGVAIAYLDGVELARNENFTFDLAAVSTFTRNAIGRASINYSPYLNGVVDEFRMYDYALSASQVKGLFNLTDLAQEYFE